MQDLTDLRMRLAGRQNSKSMNRHGSESVSVLVEELLLLCRIKTALQLEIVKFRCIHCRSWPEDIPRLRGLRVFLSIMVALCGLIQLYLMNISSTSLSPWIWNVLAIVGFLMGVLRYKIFDYSKEDKTKLTFFIGFLLIVNIILFGIWSYFQISDMESVLASSFVLTMMNFEESTWFFLCNLRERTEVDIATS